MPTWAGLQLEANRHLVIGQADWNAQPWCTNSGFYDRSPPQHHLRCHAYTLGLKCTGHTDPTLTTIPVCSKAHAEGFHSVQRDT